MKTFNEIVNDKLTAQRYTSVDEFIKEGKKKPSLLIAIFSDCAEIYANSVAKQALEDAANNAQLEPNGMLLQVDKQSILDTEIKTP